MKLRSNEDLIDSVNRISAIEFEQENPVKVKIKKKPKPDKKTINPGRAGKGNFNVGGSVKEDKGFPDFSGDGQITQKDILMGKGVIPKVKQRLKKDFYWQDILIPQIDDNDLNYICNRSRNVIESFKTECFNTALGNYSKIWNFKKEFFK